MTLSFIYLLTACVIADAQNGKPVIFTTQSNLAIARFKSGETDKIPVRGRAAFTLTEANDDDTLKGTVAFTIPDDGRKKLAQISGKDLGAVPTNYLKKDVIAIFRKGTACPIAHIVIPTTELNASGIKLQLDRVEIEISENQQPITQLLCAWTRQINANRQRRGIIAAINRLITGWPEESSSPRP